MTVKELIEALTSLPQETHDQHVVAAVATTVVSVTPVDDLPMGPCVHLELGQLVYRRAATS